jgi:hypothetical protein
MMELCPNRPDIAGLVPRGGYDLNMGVDQLAP